MRRDTEFFFAVFLFILLGVALLWTAGIVVENVLTTEMVAGSR